MSGAYNKFASLIEHEVDQIVELGSRDGKDAIWLAEHFDAEVVAWEANPDAIMLCRYNLLGRIDVTLVELAVWSVSGFIDFHPVVNGNLGASSAFKADTSYPYEKPYQQTTISVPCERLDSWWGRRSPPDLLCMDLQGAEIEALKSCGDLLNGVKTIITEGQWKRLYHDTPLISDIEEFLKPYGFELVETIAVNDYFGDFMFQRNPSATLVDSVDD